MVQYFPSPDYRSLLPPLLACLPTAFASPRPPPALLPLLSPILRQRVHLLATTASSSTESWLRSLCWEKEPAEKLVEIVSESDAFELHPISGEIDFGDVEEVMYRRLDEETLQARLIVSDLGIIAIYLWCEGDQEGGGSGWRVSEVRPLEGDTHGHTNTWLRSIDQADEKYNAKMMDDALQQGEDHSVTQGLRNGYLSAERPTEDDDDYWAQYDSTPGRTPAPKSPSPGPDSTATQNTNGHARSTSEADYYARYAQVQPEMDNDDPSEDRQDFGESTLRGNVVTQATHQPSQQTSPPNDTDNGTNGSSEAANVSISQPIASSPRTRSSTISKLEETAESQCMTESAVTHHISTSMKSLFRLARSSGIELAEFDRMIRTELDTLSMMDGDE